MLTILQKFDVLEKYRLHRAIATSFAAMAAVVGHYHPAWLGMSHPVGRWLGELLVFIAVLNWPVVRDDYRKAKHATAMATTP